MPKDDNIKRIINKIEEGNKEYLERVNLERKENPGEFLKIPFKDLPFAGESHFSAKRLAKEIMDEIKRVYEKEASSRVTCCVTYSPVIFGIIEDLKCNIRIVEESKKSISISFEGLSCDPISFKEKVSISKFETGTDAFSICLEFYEDESITFVDLSFPVSYICSYPNGLCIVILINPPMEELRKSEFILSKLIIYSVLLGRRGSYSNIVRTFYLWFIKKKHLWLSNPKLGAKTRKFFSHEDLNLILLISTLMFKVSMYISSFYVFKDFLSSWSTLIIYTSFLIFIIFSTFSDVVILYRIREVLSLEEGEPFPDIKSPEEYIKESLETSKGSSLYNERFIYINKNIRYEKKYIFNTK